MKSSREIMDSLYKRREDYLNEKKKVRKKIIKTLACGLAICLFGVIIGMVIWGNIGSDNNSDEAVEDAHKELEADSDNGEDNSTPAPENNDELPEEPVDHFPDINTDTINYSPVVMDQTDYENVYSLLGVSELIIKGKVISHKYVETALETGIPINEKVDDQAEYYLKTVYEIEVEEVYKGTAADKIVLNFNGVQRNGEKEEQVRVIKEAAELKGNDENIKKYLVSPDAWNDFIITDGSEYIFCLRKHHVSGWSTINVGQGIYRLDDPTIKNHWGYLSAEEILKVFE